MRQPKVAQRYAKALYGLAVETAQLEEVKKDLDAIRAIQIDELRIALMSPVIRGDQKIKIFAAIFGDKVSKLTTAFFNLLFNKGREVAMNEILDSFDMFWRQHHKIEVVEITTALPVDDTMNNYIKSKLNVLDQYKDRTLEVKSKVDESIIGGFIVQVGDLFYDASIRHDLQVIKKQFIENMYVQKIR
ncbi:MAG: ATP synthase F1 subunit delta [Chitinophagaceae bacterium]